MFGADQKACQKLQERLRAKGFESHMGETVNDQGTKMYRVWVGTFKSKEEAAVYASRLRAENFDCFVRPTAPVTADRISELEPVAPDPGARDQSRTMAARGHDILDLPESARSKMKVLAQADNATGDLFAAPETDRDVDESDIAEEEAPEEEDAVEQPQMQVPEGMRRLADRSRSAHNHSDNQTGNTRTEKGEKDSPGVGEAASSRPAEKRTEEGRSAHITKIYKYYDKKGIIHLTNAYKDIPLESRKNISQISAFPVRIIAFDSRDMLFQIEMDGERKKLRLVEIKPAAQRPGGGPLESFQEQMYTRQCRLIYDPGSGEKGNLLQGSLYLKTGESVGFDMVRRGLALCNQEKLPPDKRQRFLDAQEQAKKKKIGIWQ